MAGREEYAPVVQLHPRTTEPERPTLRLITSPPRRRRVAPAAASLVLGAVALVAGVRAYDPPPSPAEVVTTRVEYRYAPLPGSPPPYVPDGLPVAACDGCGVRISTR